MVTTGVSKWSNYDQRARVTAPLWANPPVSSVLGKVLFEYTSFERFEFPESYFTDQGNHQNLTMYVSRKVEPRIWITVPGSTNGVANTMILYRVAAWTHEWIKVGNGYKVVFSYVAITVRPHNPNYVPGSKIPKTFGPTVVLTPRELVKHARALRLSMRKQSHAQVKKWHGYNLSLPPKVSRINPTIVNKAVTYAYESNDSGYHETPGTAEVYRRAWSPNRNPSANFRSLKRRKLPVNSWHVSIVKTKDPVMPDLRVAYNSPLYYSNQWLNTGAYFAAPSSTSHDVATYNKALSRLLKNSEIGIGGNIAQDLVQWGQTTGLIAENAVRLADSLTHLKKRQYVLAWKALYESPRFVKGVGYVRGRPIAGLTITPHVERNTELGKYFQDLRPGLKLSGGPSKGPANSPSVKYLSMQQFLRHAPGMSTANNLLALQYGWKPLLMDMHEALNSLAKYFVESPGTVRTARGSAHAESITRSELGTTSSRYQKTGDREDRYFSSCKIGLRYTIDSKLRVFAAQTGFTNPINLAWEVLPWSFVGDWMYPVGQYFESFSAFDGLEFIDGFVTSFSTLDCRAAINYEGPYPAYPYENGGYKWSLHGNFERKIILFDRARLTSFPTMQRPQLKNPFSTTHVLNALALLRSAFHS